MQPWLLTAPTNPHESQTRPFFDALYGCQFSQGTLRGHQTRLQTKPFTLWLFNIAVENGQFIGALPIKHGGSF